MSLLQCALLLGGCAKAQAKAAPEGPPLAVPMPPPRVIVPVEEPLAENPPQPEPTAPAQPTPPPRASTQRSRQAPTTATAPAPDPEAKPDTSAAPPAPVAEAPRPVPTADPAAERRVRDVLTKATNDLKRVDWQKLTADGKEQYELSKSLNDQGEQALKNRNYTYAATLAEKAATLATQLLQGR